MRKANTFRLLKGLRQMFPVTEASDGLTARRRRPVRKNTMNPHAIDNQIAFLIWHFKNGGTTEQLMERGVWQPGASMQGLDEPLIG